MYTLTEENLLKIMPNCPNSAAFTAALNAEMAIGEIDTKDRVCMFLAQVAEESNQLRGWVENLNYSAQALMKTWPRRFPTIDLANQYARQPQKIANFVYANRLGNGDVGSGDGWKYRGRCPIQITGKDTYADYGTRIGVDLVSNPDQAEDPNIGFKIAVSYWMKNGLNIYADSKDVRGATHVINGGYTNLTERQAFYDIGQKVL